MSENVTIELKGKMRRINWRSDIILRVQLLRAGKPVAAPTWDFKFELWTEPRGHHHVRRSSCCGGPRVYVCGRKGTTYKHCSVNDDGTIMLYIDNPHFEPGQLMVSYFDIVPDVHFDDGDHTICCPQALPVEIVTTRGSDEVVMVSLELNAYEHTHTAGEIIYDGSETNLGNNVQDAIDSLAEGHYKAEVDEAGTLVIEKGGPGLTVTYPEADELDIMDGGHAEFQAIDDDTICDIVDPVWDAVERTAWRCINKKGNWLLQYRNGENWITMCTVSDIQSLKSLKAGDYIKLDTGRRVIITSANIATIDTFSGLAHTHGFTDEELITKVIKGIADVIMGDEYDITDDIMAWGIFDSLDDFIDWLEEYSVSSNRRTNYTVTDSGETTISVYPTTSEVTSGSVALVTSGAVAAVAAALESALAGKADVSHTHSVEDVTTLHDKLQTLVDADKKLEDNIKFALEAVTAQLDTKADKTHTHEVNDITNLYDYIDAIANRRLINVDGIMVETTKYDLVGTVTTSENFSLYSRGVEYTAEIIGQGESGNYVFGANFGGVSNLYNRNPYNIFNVVIYGQYDYTLISVNYAPKNLDWAVFGACKSLRKIIMPDAIMIGVFAFYECTGLTSIELPNVTTLGGYAFSGCTGLTSIELPNVTTLGGSAFSGCTGLTSIELPNVTTLGGYAFRGCTGLTSIEVPNVTTLGRSAFSGCTGLTSIELPNVTTLEQYAFRGCTGLETITWNSQGIEGEIGFNAFGECTSLKTVIIKNANKINAIAFQNCTSLAEVTVKNNEPPTIDSSIFAGCTALSAIYVPADSVDKYKAASYWSNYADIIQAIP